MSELMLAVEYELQDPCGWWMSEKLDGVRAWWTGEVFLSRSDNVFRCPEFIKDEMPGCVLDCEIWGGRGMFQSTLAAVKRDVPKPSEWEVLTVCVIDMPIASFTIYGPLESRLCQNEVCRIIPQVVCKSREELQDRFDTVTREGGEGLVLRGANSAYTVGRSNQLLKLKPVRESEGVIVGRRTSPGNNKRTACVMLQWCNNVVFGVGGGWTEEERMAPVPIGKKLRFAYQFLSDEGVPKCAQKVGLYGF